MTDYEFKTTDLTGEELLSLGECLIDIINFDDSDSNIEETVEDYHQRKYDFYCNHHPEYKHNFDGCYDHDDAWMHAERAVTSMLLGKVNNDMINNYFNCRGDFYNDEQKEIWKKAVTVNQKADPYNGPDYSCCDRYDFTMCRH